MIASVAGSQSVSSC